MAGDICHPGRTGSLGVRDDDEFFRGWAFTSFGKCSNDELIFGERSWKIKQKSVTKNSVKSTRRYLLNILFKNSHKNSNFYTQKNRKKKLVKPRKINSKLQNWKILVKLRKINKNFKMGTAPISRFFVVIQNQNWGWKVTWLNKMFWLVQSLNERDFFKVWAWGRPLVKTFWLVHLDFFSFQQFNSKQQFKYSNSSVSASNAFQKNGICT